VSSRSGGAEHLRDLARLRRVRDRIDREYARPLDVEALARGAHMSAGHLSRQFRRAYGESPYGYLMTRRVERAMALLRRGDLSVTEVCHAVGCASLGTFSTRFTELVGMPPGAYRRAAAASAQDAMNDPVNDTMNTDPVTEGVTEDGVADRGVADDRSVEVASGVPSCVARQVTRPVRNRDAPARRPPLA
jgi:AraC-like DNA-binding protein